MPGAYRIACGRSRRIRAPPMRENDADASRPHGRGGRREVGGRPMNAAEDHWIADALLQFRKYKKLAEGALAQVADADFFRAIDPDSNSVALVVKHMAGNMRSRWTDFRTTDGEKPDRDRDEEFEAREADTREGLMAAWEAGWTLTFEAIAPLRPEDLLAEVRIRGQAHTVIQ